VSDIATRHLCSCFIKSNTHIITKNLLVYLELFSEENTYDSSKNMSSFVAKNFLHNARDITDLAYEAIEENNNINQF
jgi:hypothetical protein